MENIELEVDFHKYCNTCNHKDLEEKFDPCHECLSNPTNVNSVKPLRYEANEKLVAEEAKKEAATEEG